MFVTLEGVEGSGKTSVIRSLSVRLEERGVGCLLTRQPGGSGLGKKIRPMLLDVGGNLEPLAELFLFQADRAQHVARVIRPALTAGTWVICDRYADSTIAYQGYGRGLVLRAPGVREAGRAAGPDLNMSAGMAAYEWNRTVDTPMVGRTEGLDAFGKGEFPQHAASLSALRDMCDMATGGLWPDLTLLLDIDPRIGLERANRRNAELGLTSKEGRFEAERLAFHQAVRHGYLELARREPDRFVVLNGSLPMEGLAHAAWLAVEARMAR